MTDEELIALLKAAFTPAEWAQIRRESWRELRATRRTATPARTRTASRRRRAGQRRTKRCGLR